MKTDYNQVSAAYDGRYARHSYPGLAAAREGLASGALHKSATSQLSELSDQAYQRGIRAIEAAAEAAEARQGVLRLQTDLKLYAATGWKPL